MFWDGQESGKRGVERRLSPRGPRGPASRHWGAVAFIVDDAADVSRKAAEPRS